MTKKKKPKKPKQRKPRAPFTRVHKTAKRKDLEKMSKKVDLTSEELDNLLKDMGYDPW